MNYMYIAFSTGIIQENSLTLFMGGNVLSRNVFKQLRLVAPTPPVTPPFPGISGAGRKLRGALPPSGLSGHQVPTY